MTQAAGSRALASRYANALLAVAVDKDAPLDKIGSELHEVSDLLAKEERLAEVLGAPTIPASKRVEVLQKILEGQGLTPYSVNTLRLLTEKDRIAMLPEVSEQYRRLLMEHNKVESGEVTSAHPLTSEQQSRLAEQLGKALGKTMELGYRTDSELVGGLVVRIGNRVYDASVKNELRRIKEKTLAGL